MFTFGRLSNALRVPPMPAAGRMGARDAEGAWNPAAVAPRRGSRLGILRALAAAAIPVAGAGCSNGIDVGNDGATGHLNPHPVKRYEVIATSHAPGPWDTFEGAYIGYDVVNKKCVPMIPFVGQQQVPNTGLKVPMTRVDDHTWKGYFYRDALQDEDYFKLGVCHWNVTSVSASAIARGLRFAWSGSMERILREGGGIRYFKKIAYGDKSLVPYGAPDFDPADSEVLQHPDAYFSVTLVVREAQP